MRRLAASAGIAFFVFCVGLTTVCPTVPAGDSGELISVSHCFGVAHPPGYPLFTLLGALADRLIPFGEPGFRINLLSLLFAALSAAWIVRIVVRLGGSELAGLFGAGLFAFSPVVWRFSNVAEVFSLNAFLNLLAVDLALLYVVQKPKLGKVMGRGVPFAVGVVFGLGMSNHHTTVLVGFVTVMVVAGALLYRGVDGLVDQVSFGVLGFVAGLVPYATIPLAASFDPPLNWDDPVSLGRFWTLITRGDYGSFQLVSTEIEGSDLFWYSHLLLFVNKLWRDVLFVGVVPAVVGAFSLVRGKTQGEARAGGLLVVAVFLATSVVFLLFVNAPIDNPIFLGVVERFYILPEAFFAVLIGVGFDKLLPRIGSFGAMAGLRVFAVVVAVGLAIGLNHSGANQRSNFVVRDFGKNLLCSLPHGALLFSRSDLVTNALCYQQIVLGERPDVVVLDQEKLTYSWFAAASRERFPRVDLPGERYDGEITRNIDLIRQNEEEFPIFFFDFKEMSYTEAYADEPHGLVRRIVRKGSESSPAELYETNSHLFAQFETGSFSENWGVATFEWEAMAKYSEFLFNLGWQASESGRFEESESLYVESARLNETDWRVFRNLGVLLADRRGKPIEAADALERSLVLHPEDPVRADVEARIRYLRTTVNRRSN